MAGITKSENRGHQNHLSLLQFGWGFLFSQSISGGIVQEINAALPLLDAAQALRETLQSQHAKQCPINNNSSPSDLQNAMPRPNWLVQLIFLDNHPSLWSFGG